MARLGFFTTASLDGYIADEEGKFDFAVPDEEIHAFINDLIRPFGTHLYGRRNYEVMLPWEEMGGPDDPPAIQDFAGIWRDVDKVVYSSTLPEVSTPRTRLVREFDPEDVRRMKAEHERDLIIGGPTLAANAFRAGLVDDWHLMIAPALLGGGLPALAGVPRLPLELVDEHRFPNGTVYLRYVTQP